MDLLTPKQLSQLNSLNIPTKKMSFGAKIQAIITAINSNAGEKGATGDKGPTGDKGLTGDQGPGGDMIPAGTPVNAVNATKVLTISGVVIDGETVTIGEDVYEFVADTAKTVTEGNIAVDIAASTVKATDDLTMDTNPIAGNTMTIGTKVFTFVPLGTANADGEIDVAALLADTQVNVIAAIKGDAHNSPHPLVTCGDAFAADVLAITALVGGVAGNDIATVETFTAGTNVFSAVKLATGSDCTAANAVTALVATVTASDTQGVGAVDGNGNTVELTADVAGVIGNDIALDESMATGEFTGGAVFLSGGIDGTVGAIGDALKDTGYLYVCVAANTIADKNWRRVSLGTAY